MEFIKKLRNYYPHARLICITSPMADERLSSVQKNYLKGIVSFVNKDGDKKVSRYFFNTRYSHGCGTHPDLEEHKQIAEELSVYIKKQMGW